MKTIVITSFHPHISRNILATDAFSRLKSSPDLRIVVVTAPYKVEYFMEQFGGGNVVVEGAPLYRSSQTFRGLLFKRLGIFLFNTSTARLRKRYEFYHQHKVCRYLFSRAMGVVGRSFFLRRFFRWLDLRCSPKGFFDAVLERWKPDALFSTDLQNENDVSAVQDAERRRIPVIGMLRSWDNTTQRILRVLPEILFVGSIALKAEVLKLYRYPESRIRVVGNPHYDRYLEGSSRSKEDLCRAFGLDPSRRLILYAPVGDILIKKNDIDQYVMQLLGMVDASVLVRFPPDEAITLTDFILPANMALDRPGKVFKDTEFADREIQPEDDQRLIDSIYHADLVITGPTSICLDAALMDRPVIAVNCYPSPRNFYDSVWSYRCDHTRKLLATGGVRYVTTKDEFFVAINEYFSNPDRDREGRARVRALWFSHADGHAGERFAGEVLNFLERS